MELFVWSYSVLLYTPPYRAMKKRIRNILTALSLFRVVFIVHTYLFYCTAIEARSGQNDEQVHHIGEQ